MRRPGERAIPGKFTVRVGSRKLVLTKGSGESERHVLLKALLFARYSGEYPGLLVERSVGMRYKPDVVEIGTTQSIRFWGECGVTSRQKVQWLVRHVREGHLVFARQAGASDTFVDVVADAVHRQPRHGLIEVLTFGDDAWDQIADDGTIEPAALRPTVTRFDPTPSR